MRNWLGGKDTNCNHIIGGKSIPVVEKFEYYSTYVEDADGDHT